MFGSCLLEPSSFLKRNGRGMDLGGMEGGKTVLGMCCIREESVSNFKNNEIRTVKPIIISQRFCFYFIDNRKNISDESHFSNLSFLFLMSYLKSLC